MPVRDYRHGAGATAFAAHQAPADFRPWLIVWQRFEPDIDDLFTVAIQATDIAGDVAVGSPARGTAWRILAGPFAIAAHGQIRAMPRPRGKSLELVAARRGTARSRSSAEVAVTLVA